MGYNKDFFDAYKNYLRESTVRFKHNSMMRIFYSLIKHIPKTHVVDLGCGSCEYYEYGGWTEYLGIDMEPRPSSDARVIKADYKNYSLIQKRLDEANFHPNIFVSLFSTECCLPTVQKYKLYDDMFSDKNILAGCVAGFYYKHQEQHETVQEVGLTSYQTVEDPKYCKNPAFVELRTHIDVPSKMFGSDVVEVWKFFVRNKE
jgi:hypothetical protein